jgi:hypothetical protein
VTRAGEDLVRSAHRAAQPEADFDDFARATVDIAGELYGNGGEVQRIIAGAWSDVGLKVPLFACTSTVHTPHRRRRQPAAAAIGNVSKWRQRPAR